MSKYKASFSGSTRKNTSIRMVPWIYVIAFMHIAVAGQANGQCQPTSYFAIMTTNKWKYKQVCMNAMALTLIV